MGLWGASDATEDQPKHFTTEQKEDVVANEHGWTVKAGSTMTGNDNTSADPEILVFIRGLDNKLGVGDITGFDWNISEFDKSEGGTLSVTAHFNEAVTVTGTPITDTLRIIRNFAQNTFARTYTYTHSGSSIPRALLDSPESLPDSSRESLKHSC